MFYRKQGICTRLPAFGYCRGRVMRRFSILPKTASKEIAAAGWRSSCSAATATWLWIAAIVGCVYGEIVVPYNVAFPYYVVVVEVMLVDYVIVMDYIMVVFNNMSMPLNVLGSAAVEFLLSGAAATRTLLFHIVLMHNIHSCG